MNGYDPISVPLSTGISLLLLWILIFELYRKYRLDLFRQGLFTIRDELFDLGRAGRITFDHPAYGHLRSTINGYIRFGSRLSFLALLLHLWFLEAAKAEQVARRFERTWLESLETLDPEVRAAMLDLRDRMGLQLVEQVLLGSPLLLILFVPVVAGSVLIYTLRTRLVMWLRRTLPADLVDRADATALAVGTL